LARAEIIRTFGSGDNVSLGEDTDTDVPQGTGDDFDGNTVADFAVEDRLEFLTQHRDISSEMSHLSSTVFTLQSGEGTGEESPGYRFMLTGGYSLGAFLTRMMARAVGYLQALPEMANID
jgi:hypothetical protein